MHTVLAWNKNICLEDGGWRTPSPAAVSVHPASQVHRGPWTSQGPGHSVALRQPSTGLPRDCSSCLAFRSQTGSPPGNHSAHGSVAGIPAMPATAAFLTGRCRVAVLNCDAPGLSSFSSPSPFLHHGGFTLGTWDGWAPRGHRPPFSEKSIVGRVIMWPAPWGAASVQGLITTSLCHRAGG